MFPMKCNTNSGIHQQQQHENKLYVAALYMFAVSTVYIIFLGARVSLGLLYVKVKVKMAKKFWNSKHIPVLFESNKIARDS